MPLELVLPSGGKRKGIQSDNVQKPKGKTGEPAVTRGQQEVSVATQLMRVRTEGRLQRDLEATRERRVKG